MSITISRLKIGIESVRNKASYPNSRMKIVKRIIRQPFETHYGTAIKTGGEKR